MERVILVVDDEPVVRSFVSNACKTRGLRPLVADDGQQGYELFLQLRDQIALVLTDVSMPRLSGPQLVRRIRAERPGTPILLMTGYSPTMVIPTDVFDCPMLRKPFTVETLMTAIDTAMRSRDGSSSAYAD